MSLELRAEDFESGDCRQKVLDSIADKKSTGSLATSAENFCQIAYQSGEGRMMCGYRDCVCEVYERVCS